MSGMTYITGPNYKCRALLPAAAKMLSHSGVCAKHFDATLCRARGTTLCHAEKLFPKRTRFITAGCYGIMYPEVSWGVPRLEHPIQSLHLGNLAQ